MHRAIVGLCLALLALSAGVDARRRHFLKEAPTADESSAIPSIDKAFEHFDQNHDGKIEFSEYADVTRDDQPNLDPKDVYTKFASADLDDNGELTQQEFEPIYRDFEDMWKNSLAGSGSNKFQDELNELLKAKMQSADDARSSRRFLHDVLDRLYSEQEDAILTYNEEIEVINKEIEKLGERGQAYTKNLERMADLIEVLKSTSDETQAKIDENRDTIRSYQDVLEKHSGGSAKQDDEENKGDAGASLLEKSERVSRRSSAKASTSAATTAAHALLLKKRAESDHVLRVLREMQSLPTVRAKLRHLQEALRGAQAAHAEPFAVQFLNTAVAVVKRAEPGSVSNDLGAAIPVSELTPIVQGLMDDVLAFQRLLSEGGDAVAGSSADVAAAQRAALEDALTAAPRSSSEAQHAMFNREIAKLAARTAALESERRRQQAAIAGQNKDMDEMRAAIKLLASQSKALEVLRGVLTDALYRDSIQRHEEYTAIHNLVEQFFPRKGGAGAGSGDEQEYGGIAAAAESEYAGLLDRLEAEYSGEVADAELTAEEEAEEDSEKEDQWRRWDELAKDAHEKKEGKPASADGREEPAAEAAEPEAKKHVEPAKDEAAETATPAAAAEESSGEAAEAAGADAEETGEGERFKRARSSALAALKKQAATAAALRVAAPEAAAVADAFSALKQSSMASSSSTSAPRLAAKQHRPASAAHSAARDLSSLKQRLHHRKRAPLSFDAYEQAARAI